MDGIIFAFGIALAVFVADAFGTDFDGFIPRKYITIN
jgi:hypothetical protein